jgi:hypothetical protein
MTADHYSQLPEFDGICDAFADKRLVVVTGAGVSRGLKWHVDPELSLPTWPELLRRLRMHFDDKLDTAAAHLTDLLDDTAVHADYLIEAATLIKQAVGDEAYYAAVAQLVTPAAPGFTDLHQLIEDLQPVGIVTFNYDCGHENAALAVGEQVDAINYDDDEGLGRVFASDFEQRFIVKAHGCVRRPESIVLDHQSYKRIIDRHVLYRSLIHHLLVRFNVLVIGFGMSDPDFDELLDSFASIHRRGVRQHFYLWKAATRPDERAKAVLLRNRFKFAWLPVREFAEIPEVLRSARRHAGPRIRQLIVDATADSLETRRAAHAALHKLSVSGAAIASNLLKQIVTDPSRSAHEGHEALYSLGHIRPPQHDTGEFLIAQLLEDADPEVVAHALYSLLQIDFPVVQLPALVALLSKHRSACEAIDRRVQQQPKDGSSHPGPRAVTYLEATLAKWQAVLCSTNPPGKA